MLTKHNRKLKFFDNFIFAINCILSAALLLSYLAPYADPRSYWPIAFLGLAYPFLLPLNLLFIVYWLIRHRLYSLVSVICILIGFKILMANFGFRLPSSARVIASPRNIRIMAYNVHGFGGFDRPNQKAVQDSMMQLISDQHPDIINMEEFYENIDTQKPIYFSLHKIMQSGYQYFQPYDYTQWDSTGVAIFSKYPIINHGIIISPKERNSGQAIFVDIKKGYYIFRIYCVHMQSTLFDDNEHQYLRALTHRAKISRHELKIIGSKLKSAFIKRSFQVSLLKQDMSKCPYPYVVAGDFNDTPISYTINQLGKGLSNAFVQRGSGLGITYYGDFPNLQIDYIFAAPQFNVLNYRAIDKKLSDHYPIVSDLFFTGK